ncbi:hypothetical protein RhiirA5_406964 [Rhizophagus irregularis]|uniref:Uncharacterized protein n=1 Tax=Rhizophagus irregularis TaxID=588596 RepID=A0A2N0QBP5_9GLOM|nr:hypothetical protein RhiirA5_406964 [Rhizophagus irregularis]UZO09199.1 hypothetical protein OCT59_029436 [Rhizophagus irregularis]
MVEDFNKLNAVFGDRIKDISGNAESSKGKEGKKIETDSDLLNVNKKRIAQTQDARDDSDINIDTMYVFTLTLGLITFW